MSADKCVAAGAPAEVVAAANAKGIDLSFLMTVFQMVQKYLPTVEEAWAEIAALINSHK